MTLDAGAAALAGLVAGVVMVVFRMGIRAAGVALRMDVIRMWVTMFRLRGTLGWVAGLAMHVLVSAGVGLFYAIGLQLLGAEDALWLWGLLGGSIHYAIAGLFLAVAPDLNPEMPDRIPAPGAFASRLGTADVAGFLVGHLAYGVAFALTYGLLHAAGGPDILV